MVKEQLDQQAEVLAVDLVGVAVNLEYGQAVLPVNIKKIYISVIHNRERRDR